MECSGDYAHAIDLIRDLKEIGGFSIGGACYPECHPECRHLSEDIGYLKDKVDAGLDFMTTQMFFDNNIFYRYLYKLREKGIEVPESVLTVAEAKEAVLNILGKGGKADA